MTSPTEPDRPAPPTVQEIAALTARLRSLSAAGADIDDAEREAFLADKDALLVRIAAHEVVHRHEPILGRQSVDGPAVPAEEWHPLGSARLDLPVATDAGGEQARRDQLNRWHTTDATEVTDQYDGCRVRGDHPENAQEAP